MALPCRSNPLPLFIARLVCFIDVRPNSLALITQRLTLSLRGLSLRIPKSEARHRITYAQLPFANAFRPLVGSVGPEFPVLDTVFMVFKAGNGTQCAVRPKI